jgi:uncharacterized protein (DUF1697 family)
MPKYVAFLRAINVGGHLVKMDQLRMLFEALGFDNVETFIASGNVIFDAKSKTPAALEKKIEGHLLKALGYPVETFLRTVEQVVQVAKAQPFAAKELTRDGTRLYVGFLAETPSEAAKAELAKCRNKANDFSIAGREVFWLCRVKFSETDFSGARLEKILKLKTTLRNINTPQRIAAKYQSVK